MHSIVEKIDVFEDEIEDLIGSSNSNKKQAKLKEKRYQVLIQTKKKS